MKTNWRMLAIVPGSMYNDTTKSGVGTYIECLKAMGFCDFISDGEFKSSVGQSKWMQYGDPDMTDAYKVAHIQSELLQRLSEIPYRAIVCSTFEGVEACVSLGLPKIMPVFYRTHNSHILTGDSGAGFEKSHRLMLQSKATGVRVLANCAATGDKLREIYGTDYIAILNRLTVPMLHPKKQDGLLIVSRYDDVKRPRLASRIAAATGLPVYVLTGSKQQAKRWTQDLEDCGCTNVDVRYGLSGKDKWQFISSRSAALLTSKVESFGMAAAETIPFCPTFIVHTSEYDWTKNLDELNCSELINRFVIDTSSKKQESVVVDAILAATKSKYISKSRRSELVEFWSNLSGSQWFNFMNTVSVEDDSKPFKTELGTRLESGEAVDWFEVETLARTVKALHKCIARYPMVVSGSVLRIKSRRSK